MSYPKKIRAIKVKQPFGEFFVMSINASDLLELSFSDALRYDENQVLRGSQRELDEKRRVKEITDYINSEDLAFPNSIIIAANYNEEGFIEEDEHLRWKFHLVNDDLFQIEIPSTKKLAAIIDGQHRLNGFRNANTERKTETELLVSVYFDLPAPYQAYLFASINYNQKPVNKSLALEQFGYLTELTPVEGWSPELLSVFLTRKLNLDSESSFYNHVKVAPQNDEFLLEISPKEQDWLVSTATVVDGILKLITSNPKRDSNKLNSFPVKERKREVLGIDNTPLRKFYLENNDLFIYKTVVNYFNAVEKEIFFNASKNSFIKKTIGIQALFFILKTILSENLGKDKNISEEYFRQMVQSFTHIDFSDNFFTASGIGKSRIQNIILILLNYKRFEDIRKKEEISDYKRITGRV